SNQSAPSKASAQHEAKARDKAADDWTARAFITVERALLILIAFMTLAATAIEIQTVIVNRTISLADILLMFLYLEVIGMIAVFYRG
ncbi:hypothetical protein JI667_22180, partial [Bacillus sp. NTK074B]|uniref:hypothetical protein n=1 Tax=Bacillus sp. NTK074B TaxID=2802174 RepID=UPI001A8CD789|nr:hypothetical protein [Bacillus sp. NTK074B]